MKISELAKLGGVNASRIRFYDAQGLLPGTARSANGYREYPPEAEILLNMITIAQQTGFSLKEIKTMLPQDFSSWKHEELLVMLKQKIEDINAMQERLAQNKSNLLSLIQFIEFKPDHLSCTENAEGALAQLRHVKKATA